MSEIYLPLVALAIVIGVPGCGASALPPPAPGIYQLEIVPNTLVANVGIDPRGTFRWGGGGCDVSFNDGGQWQVVDDRLVLIPTSDSTTFVWPLNRSASGVLTHDEFKRLDIAAGPREGELIASGAVPVATRLPCPAKIRTLELVTETHHRRIRLAHSRPGSLSLTLTLTYVDFYAGGRLGMGSTAIGSAPSRMST